MKKKKKKMKKVKKMKKIKKMKNKRKKKKKIQVSPATGSNVWHPRYAFRKSHFIPNFDPEFLWLSLDPTRNCQKIA
jgi:hypothetical protein